MQPALIIAWLLWVDFGHAGAGDGSTACEDAEAEDACDILVAEAGVAALDSVGALKKLYGCVGKLRCMKEMALEVGKVSWEANNKAVGEYAKLANNIAELGQDEPFDIAFAVDQKLRYDALQHHLQNIEESLPHFVSGSANQSPTQNDMLETGENKALVQELKELKLYALQERAKSEKADDSEIADAVNAEDPKLALINLILSKKAVGSLVQIVAGAWKDKTGVIEEYRGSRRYPYKVALGEGESKESRWFTKHEMKVRAKDSTQAESTD
jgi:hypothetical protein